MEKYGCNLLRLAVTDCTRVLCLSLWCLGNGSSPQSFQFCTEFGELGFGGFKFALGSFEFALGCFEFTLGSFELLFGGLQFTFGIFQPFLDIFHFFDFFKLRLMCSLVAVIPVQRFAL